MKTPKNLNLIQFLRKLNKVRKRTAKTGSPSQTMFQAQLVRVKLKATTQHKTDKNTREN